MDIKIIIALVCICLISISFSVGGGVFFYSSSTDQVAEKKVEDSPDEKKVEAPPAEKKVEAPPKIWKKSGETQAAGGGGGEPSSLICKENTFVTEFNGGSGAVIDRIGVKCSDGTILGPAGGGGGGPFSVQNLNGFDKLVVKTGGLVDNIRFFNNNTELGTAGGGGGSGPIDLACNGGRIMGLNTRAGSLLDNIQVVCATQQ